MHHRTIHQHLLHLLFLNKHHTMHHRYENDYTTFNTNTILHDNDYNNIDVSVIAENSNIFSTIGLCDTIHLFTDNVANILNVVVLLRRLILETTC